MTRSLKRGFFAPVIVHNAERLGERKAASKNVFVHNCGGEMPKCASYGPIVKQFSRLLRNNLGKMA